MDTRLNQPETDPADTMEMGAGTDIQAVRWVQPVVYLAVVGFYLTLLGILFVSACKLMERPVSFGFISDIL